MSIQLKNIYKTYNKGTASENTVLHDVNLEINKGELIAIKGRSGAGKSTLLHIIGCLDTPTNGKFFVDNIDATELSNSKLAVLRNKKFGFVMQDFGLINDDTVIKNVSLPMMFNSTPLNKIKNKSSKILSSLNIEHLSNRIVNTLSGGRKTTSCNCPCISQ